MPADLPYLQLFMCVHYVYTLCGIWFGWDHTHTLPFSHHYKRGADFACPGQQEVHSWIYFRQQVPVTLIKVRASCCLMFGQLHWPLNADYFTFSYIHNFQWIEELFLFISFYSFIAQLTPALETLPIFDWLTDWLSICEETFVARCRHRAIETSLARNRKLMPNTSTAIQLSSWEA